MWWRQPAGIPGSAKPSQAKPCIIFRRQGRKPGGGRREAGRIDDADRPAGHGCFGQQLRTFLAAQGVDLALVKDTADIHTGTAIITIADADNTIVVVPGANALVSAEDVAAPVLAATSPSASSKFRKLRSPPSSNGRARPGRPPSSIRRRRSPAAPNYSISSISSFSTRPSLGFSRRPNFTIPTSPARFIEAARRLPTASDKIICVTLGKRGVLALVRGEPSLIAGRAVKAVDTTGAGDGQFVGALAAQLADGKRSATRLNTPMPPHRSACSGWAPRRRCRRRPRWRRWRLGAFCSDLKSEPGSTFF